MMSWLHCKLFRKPLLLKIFPKYISALSSERSEAAAGGNCPSRVGGASEVRELRRAGRGALLLEAAPSWTGEAAGVPPSVLSFPSLGRGLTSDRAEKAKAGGISSHRSFLRLQASLPPSPGASQADLLQPRSRRDHSLHLPRGCPPRCPFSATFIHSQPSDMPINTPVSLLQTNLSLSTFPTALKAKSLVVAKQLVTSAPL